MVAVPSFNKQGQPLHQNSKHRMDWGRGPAGQTV